MIYSRSAEYAIRAFVHLADVEEGKYAMVKDIAEECDIPTHFLAKILQQLAREGFLRSSKGPTGGFMLRRSADDINLLEIVDTIDGLSKYQRCAVGMAECNDEAQCGMHDSWKELQSRMLDYLEDTSILDVVVAQRKKHDAVAKKRKPRKSSKKK